MEKDDLWNPNSGERTENGGVNHPLRKKMYKQQGGYELWGW